MCRGGRAARQRRLQTVANLLGVDDTMARWDQLCDTRDARPSTLVGTILSVSKGRSDGMRYIPLLCCLLSATACDESLTGPTVSLNQEFVLAPGGSAIIEGASLAVRFTGVSGDSRCPADVVCIQGGDAIVRISVIADGGRRDYELHTGDMRPVRHDGLTIALVQLSPYPFSSRTIEPGDYRATLKVTR